MSAERGSVRQELTPAREIITSEGFRFFLFDETQTVLPHVCLEDPQTKIVVSTTLVNKDLRVAATKAWSGARHSREPGMSWDILHQMLIDSTLDADKKMDKMFSGYGHASVGDMAPIGVHIERVPMHACLAIFNNLSLNSGQEKSTRFQMKFSEAPLAGIPEETLELVNPEVRQEIRKRYQGLGELASGLFVKYRDVISTRFRERFSPSNEKEEKDMVARTLDTARVFLLLGQTTGQYVGESARNWARLIGEMKASPNPLYTRLAYQIQRLLSPTPEEEEQLGFKAESPSLIRHAGEAATVNTNLAGLRDFMVGKTDLLRKVRINRQGRGEVGQKVLLVPKGFSAAEKMVAQYLISLWPGLDKFELLSWVSALPEARKKEISVRFLFNGHDNYHELPSFTATTEQTVIFDASLAELRDLNRHRALTRFMEIPAVFGLKMDYDTLVQILSKGFVLPAYLTEIEEFSDIRKEITNSLYGYYKELYGFLNFLDINFRDGDYSFFLDLLPLTHRVPLWLHGNPKQFVYMPSQRYNPGGQINYRILAWEISQLIAGSDPYLEGLRLGVRPDPGSRREFFDRT